MFRNKLSAITVFALTMISMCAFTKVKAQTTETFATGLQSPVKIIKAPRFDGFLVAESGIPTMPNSGRISILTKDGKRFTLINGLPSGAAPPNNEPSGPSALWINRGKLYIAIGNGDSTLAGPAPGTEIPNLNPSSPIFSSILELSLPSGKFPLDNFNYQLTDFQQSRLANGKTVVLGGPDRLQVRLRLVTDFPDFTPEPRPSVPNNVRNSNPFGLALIANTLYVADAAQNKILTVEVENGETETFFTYPPQPNPSIPPIPPFVEPVPNNVRLFGDRLFVPLLTGAPFIPGFSEIRRIDLKGEMESLFISGLSSAIDIVPVTNDSNTSFYTLEFSTNLQVGEPGRIQRFDSIDGSLSVIANNLTSPTSLAVHPEGGLLVTEIFTGRVVRVTLP